MIGPSSLFLIAIAATAAVAAPAPSDEGELQKRQTTPNSEGWHDGFYYSWWSDGGAPATYTNLAGGTYEVSWQDGGNLVGGKGWNPGLNARNVYVQLLPPADEFGFRGGINVPQIQPLTWHRSIEYSGTYEYNGNSYLAVYGWTRNPLIEYYIVENWGSYDPSSEGTPLGTVTCDGSTYRLSQNTRYNKPSIDGTQTFDQYFSVRNNKRTGGTVQTGCHFDAWANAGLDVGGDHYYQILATEGYFSSGHSRITVADVG